MKNKTSKLPVLPLTKVSDPVVTDNLIQQKEANNNNRNKFELSTADLGGVSNYNSSRTKAIEEMLLNHPELELGVQILCSSVLSPNDIVTNSLYYNSTSSLVNKKTVHDIISFISNELTTQYNLESDLDDVLKESYITVGSYCKLFIPNSKLKSMIDNNVKGVSLENIVDRIGTPVSISSGDTSFDSKVNESISIVNDISILNIEKEYSNLIQDIRLENNEVSVESIGVAIGKRKRKSSIDKIFKVLSGVHKKEINMSSDDMDNNRCLVIKIPNSAVVPLYLSNDPSSAYGYYILLDGNGSPIHDNYEDNNDGAYDPKKVISDIIKKSKAGLAKNEAKAPMIKNIDKLVSKILDEELAKKILYSGEVTYINKDAKDNIMKVMLQRVLSDSKTKLLFVPADKLSYYAINFRQNGTGKPLLDDLIVQSSLRTMVKFSKVSALIRNNIPGTNVDVQLDNNDPDAPKTMETIRTYVMNTRSLSLPIGLNKTTDVVDWLHKYGFRFNFKHDSLPDMTIDSSEENRSHVVPDSDLDEELAKTMYMKIGLTPEMIENSKGADFAATIISNNLLFAKRIARIQNKYNSLITKDVINYLRNDGYLQTITKDFIRNDLRISIKSLDKDLKKSIKSEGIEDEELVNYMFEDFLNTLEVKLPPIDMKDNNGNKEAFEAYVDVIDDYIEMFFSSDALPSDYSKEIGDDVDTLQAALKNTLLRQWMKEHGFMPELAEAFTVNKYGEMNMDILDNYKLYMNNIVEQFTKFKKDVLPKEDVEEEDVEEEDEKDEDDGVEEEESENTGGDEEIDDDIEEDEDIGGDEEPIEE